MATAVPAKRDAVHDQLGYKYRSLDAIVGAVRAAFAQHGLVVVPYVESCELSEERTSRGDAIRRAIVTVIYRFVARDGSEVACRVVGEGRDTQDRAVTKAMAAAYKLALSQMFLLAADEDDHQPQTRQPARSQERSAPKEEPPDVVDLRERIKALPEERRIELRAWREAEHLPPLIRMSPQQRDRLRARLAEIEREIYGG
jgi:hypothetical protein